MVEGKWDPNTHFLTLIAIGKIEMYIITSVYEQMV